MNDPLPARAAAYRAAAAAYLRAEGRRWAAQLALHLAVSRGTPAQVAAADAAVRAAATALADATCILELTELVLCDALPHPLVLP